MDRPDKKNKQGKKAPRVPIKTYRWEDVRRARKRGGYPWTHLYKGPFQDKIDTKIFQMAERKQRVNIRDTVEIQEISNGSEKCDEDIDSQEIVTEPDDHSVNSKNADQVVIEEIDNDDLQKTEAVVMESAESSDNISQYLDKEEVSTSESKPVEVQKITEEIQSKPEELQRKRKLSAESSYSKYSLSKLGIMKKIQDTRQKLKIPKISLPVSKVRKHISKHGKHSPPQVKKDVPKKLSVSTVKTENIKPVYIHIPLKPPPGQTDEFSYLEFGDKKPAEAKTAAKQPRKINPLFREVLKNLKNLDHTQLNMQENNQVIEDSNKSEVESTSNEMPVERSPEEENKENNDVFDKLFEASSSRIQTNGDNQRSKSEEPERKRKLSLESSYSKKSLSKLGIVKKLKEASDKIKYHTLNLPIAKRKSKKETTQVTKPEKPEVKQQKLVTPKNVEPVYIHIPLKLPDGTTDEFSHLEFGTKSETQKVEKDNQHQDSLESPSPQNDDVQFIFVTAPSDDEFLDKSPEIPETPASTESSTFFANRIDELKELAKNVADKYSPETRRKLLQPVKEENGSDKVKIEEIAKDLEEVESEKLRVPLNSELQGDVGATKILVDEEDGLKLSETIDVVKPEEKETKIKKGKGKGVKKQKDAAKEPITEKVPEKETVSEKEAKTETKIEGSPLLKKKVSFKRRSTGNSKEDIYEDIQVPSDSAVSTTGQTETPALETAQSISVDDEKKALKDTSLGEDDNKWSKLGDHEYEPVNPPQNDVTILANQSTPTVRIEHEQKQETELSKTSSITSLDRRMLGGTDNDTEMTTELHRRLQAARVSEPFVPSYNDLIRGGANVPPASTTDERTNGTATTGSEQASTSSFQKTIKAKADEFKTKIQNIKRPSINLPQAPKFQKPNFQKFKIERSKLPNLPKLPDTSKIKMPSFSLPRKGGAKRSLKQRQFSTESNAGDSKKHIFDFKTYPRIFKKKPQSDYNSSSGSSGRRQATDFTTAPRTKQPKEERKQTNPSDRWGGRDSIRIPLHSEDSMEADDVLSEKTTTQPSDTDTREGSLERRMASHIRYDEDIDIDDEMNEYERENQAINSASPYNQNFNSRWNHGSFTPQQSNKEYMENIKNAEYRVTDLDSPSDDVPSGHSFTGGGSSKDKYSSEESSLGIHRRGVLEEINSDEFFLRQKGISQDNIDVGMYLSSEIREAFRTPNNALSDMQTGGYERYADRGSNQSLPEAINKRKPIKKPKRRKTPHVSQEQVNYESELEEYIEKSSPPTRPKRRSKKNKKTKNNDVVPYQETITVDVDSPEHESLNYPENLRILNKTDDELINEEYKLMYENELMEGKEQPEIKVTDPYPNIDYILERYKSEEENLVQGKPPAPPRRQKSLKSLNSEQISILDDEAYIEEKPPAPPRRQKSLKSLSLSEHNSLADDINFDREVSIMNVETRSPHQRSESFDKGEIHQYIIPEIKEVPKRPFRNRSRTRSRSRATSQQPDDESLWGAESIISENQLPCVEEPCIQDIRDSSGYAVIDKQKGYEPPLPPPRTPPRNRRSTKSSETKFFTVPRISRETTPERPRRNYSTLTTKRKSLTSLDEKENIDIEQYIEIPEDVNRDLQSGEVIQKMRDRPLPAPPRPPRKSKILQDITSEENIMHNSKENLSKLDEVEMSTQTEALSDDFVCESPTGSERMVRPSSPDETADGTRIERRLITPTHYTHEETITHAALVVEPLNGAKILPDSELTRKSRERIIPVEKASDYYDDETSEIPESFHSLKSPDSIKKEENVNVTKPVIQPDANTEVEVLRAQKLQVSDLDVDRLTVNELLANKIVVSEIDSGSLQTSEINSKTGALKIGEIELPPGIVQELIEKIKAAVEEEQQTSQQQNEKKDDEQKKTSIKKSELEIDQNIEEYPQRPPRKLEISKSVEDSPEIESVEQISEFAEKNDEKTYEEITEHQTEEIIKEEPISSQFQSEVTTINQRETELLSPVTSEEPPKRPPRQSERPKTEESDANSIKELEISAPEALPKQESPELQEPEIDDDLPPPRPPQPNIIYFPSQPPASFYALKAQKYVDTLDDNIPTVPRRRRPTKPPISRSSSEESVVVMPRTRHHRHTEPSIPQLTGQLARACGAAANNTLKRLITHFTNNVLGNADGKQDLNVMIIILLILIAGLILLGYGDEKTVVHLHHWEYFNPPRDM